MDFSVSTGAATGASRSAGEYRLYLPLILKPAGPGETPPSGPPTLDDGGEGPPQEMLGSESGPPDVGEESGPPIEELGPGSGPPPGEIAPPIFTPSGGQ
jgi:hypothetical protein